MQCENDRGRTLWLAVVILVAAFVLADFVRSPLLPSNGAGAIAAPKVTLWVPGPEAAGPAGQVAAGAAAGLDLAGHPTVVKRLDGGISAALAALLSRPARRGSDLLVLSSATVAGIGRDRTDHIVPGAAGAAVEAAALLRRSPAIGLLARERLELATRFGSGIDGDRALVETIRESPSHAVFAIPDDNWSRSELAALVERIGRGGTVPFVAYDDDDLVAHSRAEERTNLVLASRGSIAAEVGAGRLRALAWPAAAGRAPHSWVALVAPAAYRGRRLAELRGWIGQLVTEPRWRRHQRAHYRAPGHTWTPALAAMLRREAAHARPLAHPRSVVERLRD